MADRPPVLRGTVLVFPCWEWDGVNSYIAMGPSRSWGDMWHVLSPFGRVIELPTTMIQDRNVHDPLSPPAEAQQNAVQDPSGECTSIPPNVVTT